MLWMSCLQVTAGENAALEVTLFYIVLQAMLRYFFLQVTFFFFKKIQ